MPIFFICPQPTALEADRGKSITTMREIKLRHVGALKPLELDDHQHYTRCDVVPKKLGSQN
jgi:hypothetical protein